MSPSKDDILEVPAFAVYNSKKNKKKRNKKNKNNINSEEIVITELESDIEEIVNVFDRPGSSNASTAGRKNGKGKIASSKLTSKRTRTCGFEVIDIEENSSDIVSVENVTRAKKKKILDLNHESESDDEEVIVESTHRKKTDKIQSTKKSSKGRKKKRNSTISESSDVSIVEEEELEEFKYSGNSIMEGKKLFSWLINPVVPEDFFSRTWEKRPLHIKRGIPDYYKPIISTPDIDKMLRNNNVQFTKNLDVTSYSDGVRETHNPVGRALPNVVWDYYKNDCSIRLLNPQTFIPKIALLNSSIQEYFGSFVGANAYLTPPNSQGFAPHYDDIEAFILQVEGQKHWKLYSPLSKSEYLPRFSSGNFKEEEIGEPIMEITLQPGDLLYFPRGTIHQGRTVPGTHSLHVTLSCYQRNTWGDLMEKVITAAVRVAMEESLEFRAGLPHDYLNYMGIAHSDQVSQERTDFIEKIKQLTTKLLDHAPIDAAVDQMGKQFIHDSLPPVLTSEEKQCTSIGAGYRMGVNGKVTGNGGINSETKVKLLRAYILRLVSEEDSLRVYHSVDNSLEYHGEEPQYLEIPLDCAPAVEYLIRSYPNFVMVSDLPLSKEEQKVTIVGDLWDRGLLLTEETLEEQ